MKLTVHEDGTTLEDSLSGRDDVLDRQRSSSAAPSVLSSPEESLSGQDEEKRQMLKEISALRNRESVLRSVPCDSQKSAYIDSAEQRQQGADSFRICVWALHSQPSF